MRIISPEQVVRFDGKSEFVEITTAALAIDKILLRFIKYDKASEKGSRQKADISIFLDILDAQVIAGDILSGRISVLGKRSKEEAKKGGYSYAKEVLLRMGGTSASKANRADQKAEYRGFKITPGNAQPWILSGELGPGKESDQGLISPDYKAPDMIVRVPLSDEMLKRLAYAFQLIGNVWANAKFGPTATTQLTEKNEQTRQKMKAAGEQKGS